MTTQKFMGRGQLVDRLTAQMRASGVKDATGAAIAVLRKRGQMQENSTKLTSAGQARNAMTAEERAKDRAATATGKPVSSFKYDPRKNRAVKI